MRHENQLYYINESEPIENKQRLCKYDRYIRIDIYVNQANTPVGIYIMFSKYAKYFHTSKTLFILFPLISIFSILLWIGDDTLLKHSRTSTIIACFVKSFLKFSDRGNRFYLCLFSTQILLFTKHIILYSAMSAILYFAVSHLKVKLESGLQ